MAFTHYIYKNLTFSNWRYLIDFFLKNGQLLFIFLKGSGLQGVTLDGFYLFLYWMSSLQTVFM